MSDLHLDHDRDDGSGFLRALAPAPHVDLVVIAGDTYSVARSHRFIVDRMLELYPNAELVLVPGNHDYWRSSPTAIAAAWQELAHERVHLALTPTTFNIKGTRVLAGTMWFRKPTPTQPQAFIDYLRIDVDPTWYFEQAAAFEARLRADRPTIVVTHHEPSSRSTPERFRDHPEDCFFVCDMEAAIAETAPRLWLHGHTHDPCDYVLHHTRVVCNPRGYPDEIGSRPPYRVLELEV